MRERENHSRQRGQCVLDAPWGGEGGRLLLPTRRAHRALALLKVMPPPSTVCAQRVTDGGTKAWLPASIWIIPAPELSEDQLRHSPASLPAHSCPRSPAHPDKPPAPKAPSKSLCLGN